MSAAVSDVRPVARHGGEPADPPEGARLGRSALDKGAGGARDARRQAERIGDHAVHALGGVVHGGVQGAEKALHERVHPLVSGADNLLRFSLLLLHALELFAQRINPFLENANARLSILVRGLRNSWG